MAVCEGMLLGLGRNVAEAEGNFPVLLLRAGSKGTSSFVSLICDL